MKYSIVTDIRVTLGHLKVTIGNFFSELHPKVRPTCFLSYLANYVCIYYKLQQTWPIDIYVENTIDNFGLTSCPYYNVKLS